MRVFYIVKNAGTDQLVAIFVDKDVMLDFCSGEFVYSWDEVVI